MAYSVLLAAVPDDQVLAFREFTRPLPQASLSVRCSHVFVSWIQPPSCEIFCARKSMLDRR